jgi:ABC-type oligopeptide transport system ATPase subunit
MITLRHVSRIYPSPAGEVHALRDVSLDIAPHSFCAVTGPSGCGKSTLLNLLGGLDQPTSGQITVDGLALHGAGEAELTAYRRERLGIVFQFFNLLPAMLGEKDVPKRDHLVLMSGNGDLAIRDAQWKYIPDLAVADGWYAGKKKNANVPARPGLFDLSTDPGEMQNLFKEQSAEAERLADLLAKAKTSSVTRPMVK